MLDGLFETAYIAQPNKIQPALKPSVVLRTGAPRRIQVISVVNQRNQISNFGIRRIVSPNLQSIPRPGPVQFWNVEAIESIAALLLPALHLFPNKRKNNFRQLRLNLVHLGQVENTLNALGVLFFLQPRVLGDDNVVRILVRNL